MSIADNLAKILSSRYGKDVRQSIHDSISDLNQIASEAQTSAKKYRDDTETLAKTVAGTVGINDSATASTTTWSSSKLNENLDSLLNGSRNLYNIDRDYTLNSVSITCRNSTMLMNGTASGSGPESVSKSIRLAAGTYTASFTRLSGSGTLTTSDLLRVNSSSTTLANLDLSKTSGSTTFTITEATDIVVALRTQSGSVYTNLYLGIQIENGSEATDYVPYFAEGVSALNSSLDSLQNEGYAYPTINGISNHTDASGVYHKNLGIVDLGSLTWTYYESANLFRAEFTAKKYLNNQYAIFNGYCAKYTSTSSANRADKTISEAVAGKACVDIIDTSYTDAATFKSAMSGVLLYYELATAQTWNDKSIIEEIKTAITALGGAI